jgi:MSHA biogenesis protein MshN
MNAGQRAEAQYRNALAALDEGRVAAAMEGLEQALKLNARHDAARQSLVALLIEAGRNDEAMRQLEQSLAADAAQPTLAMLLARMQIERGTSGVPTLLRTLPSASGNADYHAFLAGALQREARHREAAEQYGAALRQMPEHGVWLMGLGISLQAEKRDREALAAYQRAKASGTLTPPLLAFVERKVQQIAP